MKKYEQIRTPKGKIKERCFPTVQDAPDCPESCNTAMQQELDEETKVLNANTIVQPWTMVIKSEHTYATSCAVISSSRFEFATCSTFYAYFAFLNLIIKVIFSSVFQRADIRG